jgi:hypothetical protein
MQQNNKKSYPKPECLLHYWKNVVHSSSKQEKENRRWKDVFHRSMSRSWPNEPLFTSGRMFFILPVNWKKKTGGGKMFFIVPTSGLVNQRPLKANDSFCFHAHLSGNCP